MIYCCPECKKEMYWSMDNVDDGHLTKEYYCSNCSIDVIKHVDLTNRDSER